MGASHWGSVCPGLRCDEHATNKNPWSLTTSSLRPSNPISEPDLSRGKWKHSGREFPRQQYWFIKFTACFPPFCSDILGLGLMVHRGLDAIPVGGECAVMGQVWGPTLMYDLENICLKTSRRWTQITRPLCGCWKSTLHRRWCKLLGGTWRGVKVKERNLLPRRPHWLIAPWKSCGVQRLQRLFWVSSLMSVSLEQHTKTMKDCEINCHLMQGFFFLFFQKYMICLLWHVYLQLPSKHLIVHKRYDFPKGKKNMSRNCNIHWWLRSESLGNKEIKIPLLQNSMSCTRWVWWGGPRVPVGTRPLVSPRSPVNFWQSQIGFLTNDSKMSSSILILQAHRRHQPCLDFPWWNPKAEVSCPRASNAVAL